MPTRTSAHEAKIYRTDTYFVSGKKTGGAKYAHGHASLGRTHPHIPDDPHLPQAYKEVLNLCMTEGMHITVFLLGLHPT